jgi:HAD superfamily hydrolase (TIGR01459 family)
MTTILPAFTDHFATLAPGYDVLLSDVWGVVHNGHVAFQESCDALHRFRRQGGTVVLITNAPRPGEDVIRQIARIGVPRDTFDSIVSSGDVTRSVIIDHPGEAIFHLGPERDRPIFKDLSVRFTTIEEADYVVCSGLFDDTTETPDDYRAMLEAMRTRGLFMVCGNPDVVVERGHELVYCAGAIADLYGELGGDVVYAGKPHRPIYDLALAKAMEARGKPVELERVMAIGDSIRTDLAGAIALGIDFLFVTAGIHAEEFGDRDKPDLNLLGERFTTIGHFPTAVMRRMSW